MKKNRRSLTDAAAALGRKGGKTTGAAKVRGSAEHYRALQAKSASVRRDNAKAWFCPKCDRLRTGAACALCNEPRPLVKVTRTAILVGCAVHEDAPKKSCARCREVSR